MAQFAALQRNPAVRQHSRTIRQQTQVERQPSTRPRLRRTYASHERMPRAVAAAPVGTPDVLDRADGGLDRNFGLSGAPGEQSASSRPSGRAMFPSPIPTMPNLALQSPLRPTSPSSASSSTDNPYKGEDSDSDFDFLHELTQRDISPISASGSTANLTISHSSSQGSSLSSLEDVSGGQELSYVSGTGALGATGGTSATLLITSSSTNPPSPRSPVLDQTTTIDSIVEDMVMGGDDGDFPALHESSLGPIESLRWNTQVTSTAIALPNRLHGDDPAMEILVLTWCYVPSDLPHPMFFLQRIPVQLGHAQHRPNVEEVLEAMLSQDNSMAERLHTLAKDRYRLATARNPPSEDELLRYGLGWRQRIVHGYEEHGTLNNIKRDATMRPIIRQAGDISDVLTMLEIPAGVDVFAVYFIPKVSNPLLSGWGWTWPSCSLT